MRRRKKLIFRVFKTLSLLAGIILFIIAGILFLKSDFWRVKKVTCQLNSHDCPAELKAALLRLFQTENLLFLSSAKAIEKINKSQLTVTGIKIQRRFPDELVFRLEQRKPQVAITAEGSQGGEYYLVDQEGVLVEKTNNAPDFPLLFLKELPDLAVGNKFEEGVAKDTITILVDLQWRLLKPRLAKIVSEREIEVWLEDDVQVLFSAKKDLKIQLDSLQLIFSRAKIEGEKLKRIDLRFDKPVLTYG